MNPIGMARLALAALVLAFLGACASGGGGGGGGGVVSPPALPPPPPAATPKPPPLALPPPPPAAAPGSFPSSSSQEFLNNWGPGGINSSAAWQYQNAHGEGVLIGVLDDGVDPSHPELVGRIDTVNSIDINSSRNMLTSTESHGSEISSLIASNFNNSQTVGPAYGATILAVRTDDGTGGFANSDLALAINYAVSVGVDVINLSLGSSNPSSAVLQNAIQNATAAGVIIVVSAGNDGPGATQPNYPGRLATNLSVSNGLILIAGGSNPGGGFNNVSNPAGLSANYYLVAPGWEIIVPDHGPPGAVPGFQTCGPNGGLAVGLCRIQGTSYASPHVAAAAAVLMSAFPGLTPQQVVQVILQSTDDMGIAGIDVTTGWGHLNLARAFEPIGTVSSPLAAGAVEISPVSMLGAVGAAFGDGMTRNAAQWTFASFDSFGRTYDTNFSTNWAHAFAGPTARASAPQLWRTGRAGSGVRMQMAFAEEALPESHRSSVDRAELDQTATRIEAEFASGLSLSFAAHGARTDYGRTSADVGHFALVAADHSLRLTQRLNGVASVSLLAEAGETVSGLTPQPAEQSALAAKLSFDVGRAGLDVTAGRIDEERSLLGLSWADGLGQTPAGETQFAAVSGWLQPGLGWRVSFEAEYGAAAFAQTGWLRVAEPLRTTAFSLEAARELTPAWLDANGRGRLSFTVSQPLRVESGVLSFEAPVATRYGRRSLSYEPRSFAPTPSGRELRFGVNYGYYAGEWVTAFSELAYVSEPGHIAEADAEMFARVGVRVRR